MLWHVVKPVWSTHTQWAPKGKAETVRELPETFVGPSNPEHVCACVLEAGEVMFVLFIFVQNSPSFSRDPAGDIQQI